jgi:hypothetical protein
VFLEVVSWSKDCVFKFLSRIKCTSRNWSVINNDARIKRGQIKKPYMKLQRTKNVFTLNICSRTFVVDCVWNEMAHAQKPDFVFRQKGRVHLNRWGRQFSRLLAAEVCASAVLMLDTPCSEVVWRVLATHSVRQFHLHFPSRTSPCAVTFQLDSTSGIACLSYGRFRAIRHKFHCQLQSEKPLMIGRKGWVGNPVSGRQSTTA